MALIEEAPQTETWQPRQMLRNVTEERVTRAIKFALSGGSDRSGSGDDFRWVVEGADLTNLSGDFRSDVRQHVLEKLQAIEQKYRIEDTLPMQITFAGKLAGVLKKI